VKDKTLAVQTRSHEREQDGRRADQRNDPNGAPVGVQGQFRTRIGNAGTACLGHQAQIMPGTQRRRQFGDGRLRCVFVQAGDVKLLQRLRETFGDRLTGFEVMARICLDFVIRNVPGTQDVLPGHDWYVLIQLDDSAAGTDLQSAVELALGAALEAGLVVDATVAQSETQALALWAMRENVSEAQRPEGYSIKHDISLPVSSIPEFLARAAARLSVAVPGTRFVSFGHFGDGNLHYNLSEPTAADGAARDAFRACQPVANRIVHDLVHGFGGSISAEHGLGQFKREENKRYKSALELGLMRQVKNALDPRGIMNPGKVL
jgi:FAD/FMN-containing dehydrogenase